MKKILILGGGLAQINLIKTAKKMGLFVIVLGTPGDYPGYKLADKVYIVDVFDKDAVLDVSKNENINGVSIVCTDFGLETVGYVNDKLHLSGITEASAMAATNKKVMKQLLKKHGINTANYTIVKKEDDPISKTNDLKYPLIVKAVNLQGSRGVYICRSEKDLTIYCNKSIEESRMDYCIVEEFIEGKEFGAQAFVSNGEVLFVLFHDDTLFDKGNTRIPIGHIIPFKNMDNLYMSFLPEMIKKAIAVLGFKEGAVNIDLIEKDGVPYIIELTGRAGANGLPELVSAYFGFDYYGMILKSALGEGVSGYKRLLSDNYDGFIVSKQLYSEVNGLFKGVQYDKNDRVITVDIFKKEGDIINAFRSSGDSIGRVIVSGKTESECVDYLNSFINSLNIELS